jgi:uncharacterized protein YndB with AHSA1/START domain
MRIIKKEIVINAPPAKVWEHITDPNKISSWLMPNDFKDEVGKAFSMKCEQQGPVSCVVKETVKHQKLVYTFQSDVTQVETLVTITLAQEGSATRLTLIHSGWDALPEPDQNVADQFDGGWGKFLTILQGQVTAVKR